MKTAKAVAALSLSLASMGLTAVPAAAAPPANDTWSGREVLFEPLPILVEADTSEATTDADDAELNMACGALATDASVWFEYTPLVEGEVVVDTLASDYSVGVIVATGSPGKWSVETCGPEVVAFFATSGVTYTLLVFDDQTDGGGNGGQLTFTIDRANEPPVADPNGPYSSVAGEAIVFDGTGSSDPDGDPLTFSWDWGDGSPPAGGPSPTHVYEPGVFTSCLTVTDPGGLSDTECTTAVVSDPVPVDIHPGSCPNPFNVKARGVLPAAILGTESFDVAQVDPASVTLAGVAPLRWSWEDVATPYEPDLGKFDADDCNESGPDGYGDLGFRFRAREIGAALGAVDDGDVLVLTLTGNLKSEFGGTPFIGEDVILIISR